VKNRGSFGNGHSSSRTRLPFHHFLPISSQLRRVFSYETPVFTLLVLGPLTASSLASMREAIDDVSNKLNTVLVLVNILSEFPSNEFNEGVITLIDSKQVVWKRMLHDSSVRSDNPRNAMVIVRPDEHISSTEFLEEGEVIASTTVQKIISQGQGLDSAVRK